MRISVTQAHIDAGVRKSCGRCPVALAIAEVVRPDVEVTVGIRSVGLDLYMPDLPKAVSDFIAKFDNGLPVAPFEFELHIHPSCLR